MSDRLWLSVQRNPVYVQGIQFLCARIFMCKNPVYVQGNPGAKRVFSFQVVKLTTLHTWAVSHPWENIRPWIKGL